MLDFFLLSKVNIRKAQQNEINTPPLIRSIVPVTFSVIFFHCVSYLIYLEKQIDNNYLILNENICRQISQFDRDRGIDI